MKTAIEKLREMNLIYIPANEIPDVVAKHDSLMASCGMPKYSALTEINADLLAALESLIPLAAHTSPQDISITQARAAIAKAKGQPC